MSDYINNKVAIVTGASSGLGAAIKAGLEDREWHVINWDLKTGVDLSNHASILTAAERCLHLSGITLINCAGINHLDWFPRLSPLDWDRVMAVNAKAPFLVTQALLPALRGGTVLNVVSNAADMPMTHSLLYNASKGALKSMTMQMARELRATHDITVFGISPNKLSGTGMSDAIDRRAAELRGISLEEAVAYQKGRLPFGEETPVVECANFIAWLLHRKASHRHLAGTIIPYGL
jgi:NAD(P)-dependent dehydrogenase (short-subunit alcohol dehydrogenase family)